MASIMLMISPGSYLVAPTRQWTRARVQLGGGVVFGALLPFALALLIAPFLLDRALFANSLVASLVAIIGGYYFFRSLVAFPGIRASYYILPVFSSAFATAVTLLFFLRLEYSRPLLAVSYLACIGWYYTVYFRTQHSSRLLVGVVPVGDVGALDDMDNVVWERLDSPHSRPSRYSAIVADFHAEMPDVWERYLADAALSGMTVLHIKQLRESLTGRVEIRRLSENAHGSLRPQAAYFTPKFLFDVVTAGFALALLSPLLGIVALLIKLTSPGPVFFLQQRIGYRGEPFRVWKFRTMAHCTIRGSSQSHEGARSDAITHANDSRITPIGRILRRTRIDELPQLLNVCCGQMSLIGPRPEAAVLAQWYQQEIPFYRYRHIVRPGITGWAQVNQGHVADVESVNSKLHYDFYYISNFSLWLDVLIVIRTVRTVVTGFGFK